MQRRNLIILASVSVTAVILAVTGAWCVRTNAASSGVAEIIWIPVGKVGCLSVHVRDVFGEPIANAHIHAVNVSGGSEKKTSLSGTATFYAADLGGEEKLTGLKFNGTEIMDRNAVLGMFAPSVREGLQVHVIIK